MADAVEEFTRLSSILHISTDFFSILFSLPPTFIPSK